MRRRIAVGEQAIVADAMEALRQHMDQEAPDELGRCQCHRLPAGGAIGTIILPAEGDAAIVGGDEAPVGDGDAVRVERLLGEVAGTSILRRGLPAPLLLHAQLVTAAVPQLPRRGLERSDFVLWDDATLCGAMFDEID